MEEFPFSIEWSIPESELLPFKDDDLNEDYLDKNFSSKLPGCNCYFEFYPHGFQEERHGQTWILFNINIENIKKVVADYTLTIESANYSKKIHDIIRFGHWFFIADKKDFFDSKKKFIVNGKCNVKVQGTFKFECNAAFANSVKAATEADKKFKAEMRYNLLENSSPVGAKAVEKAERFSASSLESDLPDLKSITPSANDLQKAQNPSYFDPFVEAVNEKFSTSFGESDFPEVTQTTVVVANDLQRTEIPSHLDSLIDVINENERSSTSSAESCLPVITSPTIQSDEIIVAIEHQKIENLYKPIKYSTPAETFLKECCKELGLKFMSKKCLRLLSNIKITTITSNSKPATIFSTNDKSGFGCFSLFFTGTEKSNVVIRRKVREKMMDDLVKFDEEKLKTIMCYVLTTKDLETIVQWFKCRIMVYCNEAWTKYGDWNNFGDESCVPLFVLEKKEFKGKFVYQIVLTVKED